MSEFLMDVYAFDVLEGLGRVCANFLLMFMALMC